MKLNAPASRTKFSRTHRFSRSILRLSISPALSKGSSMRPLPFFVTMTVISMTLVACKTDTAPSPGMGDYYPAPMNDPQISIVSPELREHLGFQPALLDNDGERPLSVELPVRNLTYNAYQLEYRMIFLNDGGREQSPIMGWQHLPFCLLYTSDAADE